MLSSSNPSRSINCVLLAVVGAAAPGCADEAPREIAVTEVRPLVAGPDVLAGVGELAVTEDGQIVLLMTAQSRLAVLDSSGNLLRTIGREGGGPGELRYPDTMVLRGDTIHVANRPNARLDAFRLSGEHLGSSALPPAAAGGLMAYLPGQVFLATTGGARDALAILLSGGTERPLGTPVAGARFPMDLATLKAEIAQGVVPPELQNLVRPVLAEDRSSWLVVGARGAVQHYAPDGTLAWESTVEAPLVEAARRRFFTANRQEPNAMRLHALTPFEGPVHAAGGWLWAMLRSDGAGHVRFAVFGQGGGAPALVTFPEVRDAAAFALDEERRRIYILTRDPARLVYAPVPDALTKDWRDR